MSLVFPRFMAPGVRWETPTLRPVQRQELSRTAGGAVQGKDLGPEVWTAEFVSVPLRLSAADAALADFDTLRGVVRTFFVTSTHRPFPVSLTSAAPLSGLTVTVADIRADNMAFSLTGLTPGMVLTAGDFVSITTGTGGYEFFRLARGGAADGLGETPMLEVGQSIAESVAVGDDVQLSDPPLEVRLQPGGLSDRWVGKSHKTISFNATQVIR